MTPPKPEVAGFDPLFFEKAKFNKMKKYLPELQDGAWHSWPFHRQSQNFPFVVGVGWGQASLGGHARGKRALSDSKKVLLKLKMNCLEPKKGSLGAESLP